VTNDNPQSSGRRTRQASSGPWQVMAGMKVLDRYGVSTLALIALGLFTAFYVVQPLVETARASMESVATGVTKIEEVFKASEQINREHSIRATTAIEGIKTEIAVHRQQAVDLRDGLLSKILSAQEKEFAKHQHEMELLFRNALLQGGIDCDLTPTDSRGFVGAAGPEHVAPAPPEKKGDG
jgi:hypothetical protein